MKNRDRLRRRRSFREPRARFLIVCEGEVTEPGYFKGIRSIERGIVDLEIVPAGVPKSVVERAVQLKRESERNAKARKDQNLRYNHVWCVFDIDQHPFVPEAKEQARANGIESPFPIHVLSCGCYYIFRIKPRTSSGTKCSTNAVNICRVTGRPRLARL